MKYAYSRLTALIFVAMTGLLSCSHFSRQRAIAMNNNLVQINDSLFYLGREFGNMIGDAVKSRDFGSLAPARQRFENYIDSSSASLSRLKDVYGSGALRKSEIDLLAMEKHMVADDFSPFERLTSFATLPEVSALFDKIKEDSKLESDKVANFEKSPGGVFTEERF